MPGGKPVQRKTNIGIAANFHHTRATEIGINATLFATVEPAREPLLLLPGFMPDALGFAFRVTAALLLAYLVAFAIQLDTASSAGLCVAIVAQPTPGMAMSKAVYRAIGDRRRRGCSDRVGRGLPPGPGRCCWPGSPYGWAPAPSWRRCCGISDPTGRCCAATRSGSSRWPGSTRRVGRFLATLNRVAAILLGIASVAVVNLLISRLSAFDDLVAALQTRLATADTLALSALAGHNLPTEPLPAQIGATILGLRTQAGYAAAEVPNGRDPPRWGNGRHRRVAGHALRHPRDRHRDAVAGR